MDFSPTRKKSIMSGVKGILDGLDIEIDDLDWHPVLKDLLHNVVEAGDKTAQNALLDKKILKKTEQFEEATTITRRKMRRKLTSRP
jgi:hypothetical protein